MFLNLAFGQNCRPTPLLRSPVLFILKIVHEHPVQKFHFSLSMEKLPCVPLFPQSKRWSLLTHTKWKHKSKHEVGVCPHGGDWAATWNLCHKPSNQYCSLIHGLFQNLLHVDFLLITEQIEGEKTVWQLSLGLLCRVNVCKPASLALTFTGWPQTGNPSPPPAAPEKHFQQGFGKNVGQVTQMKWGQCRPCFTAWRDNPSAKRQKGLQQEKSQASPSFLSL